MNSQEQLKSNLKNERHRNLEETRYCYYCDQYKMLAIKMEAELAAFNITSQQLRERVAELETDLKLTSEMLVGVSRKGMALHAELAALKSAPVVMPSEQHLREILDDLEDDDGCSRDDVSYGFRMAIGLITRLNRSKT